MTVRRQGAVMAWLLTLVLVGQVGCATHPRSISPPSEQVRAQLGTIGIVSPSLAPEPALQGPTSGKVAGAAKGAGLGAGYMILGGLEAGAHAGQGGAVVLLMAIGLAPVAALVGGIYGAVAAEPAAKVKEAETALQGAFADQKVQEALRDQVLEMARDRAGRRLVPAGTDVDSILEVGVSSLGLVGPPAVNPGLSLVVHACPRLIRVADDVELYPSGPHGPRALAYASAPEKFVEWGAEGARLFREEMERAWQALAEKVVEDVFLVHLPPGRRWSDLGPVPLQTTACAPTASRVGR